MFPARFRPCRVPVTLAPVSTAWSTEPGHIVRNCLSFGVLPTCCQRGRRCPSMSLSVIAPRTPQHLGSTVILSSARIFHSRNLSPTDMRSVAGLRVLGTAEEIRVFGVSENFAESPPCGPRLWSWCGSGTIRRGRGNESGDGCEERSGVRRTSLRGRRMRVVRRTGAQVGRLEKCEGHRPGDGGEGWSLGGAEDFLAHGRCLRDGGHGAPGLDVAIALRHRAFDGWREAKPVGRGGADNFCGPSCCRSVGSGADGSPRSQCAQPSWRLVRIERSARRG